MKLENKVCFREGEIVVFGSLPPFFFSFFFLIFLFFYIAYFNIEN